MKNIKHLLILALIVTSFSCTKEFLDKQPLGEPSSSILYNTEGGIQLMLNAVYGQTRDFGQSGFGWFVVKELGADDTEPGSNAGDGSVPRMRDFSNFKYLTTMNDLNSFWSSGYALIAKANLVIQYAPKVEFKDPVLRERLMAEAKFLRSEVYFNLVRGWGGVPIMTEVAGSPAEASIVTPRSSEAEVYAFIEKDLKDAIAALPLKKGYPASELGRVTKGAAQTLLAQVYLHQNKYSDCLLQAMNVINSGEYRLFDKYFKVSHPDYENKDESIYEVQYTYRTERDMPNTWQQWQGVRGSGSGWGFFSPSANLASSYVPDDPRKEYNIYFKGEPWPYSGETNIKWEAGTDPRANQKTMLPRPFPAGFAGQSPLNRVVLRYADVLLMAAECNNELGNPTEALKYLEMIRARAREGKNVLPQITTTDKMKLRHLIWDERRWELALEGYRAFDIRRYNKIEPGFAIALYQAVGKTDYTEPKHLLYPIPQAEIDFDVNKVLTQNPGW